MIGSHALLLGAIHASSQACLLADWYSLLEVFAAGLPRFDLFRLLGPFTLLLELSSQNFGIPGLRKFPRFLPSWRL